MCNRLINIALFCSAGLLIPFLSASADTATIHGSVPHTASCKAMGIQGEKLEMTVQMPDSYQSLKNPKIESTDGFTFDSDQVRWNKMGLSGECDFYTSYNPITINGQKFTIQWMSIKSNANCKKVIADLHIASSTSTDICQAILVP